MPSDFLNYHWVLLKKVAIGAIRERPYLTEHNNGRSCE